MMTWSRYNTPHPHPALLQRAYATHRDEIKDPNGSRCHSASSPASASAMADDATLAGLLNADTV